MMIGGTKGSGIADSVASALDVSVSRHELRLDLEGGARLPAFPGSELRGMIGQGLQALACSRPGAEHGACDSCPDTARGACDHWRHFMEPAFPAAIADLVGRNGPKPYVLRLPFATDRAPDDIALHSAADSIALDLGVFDTSLARQGSLLRALEISGSRKRLGWGPRCRFTLRSPADARTESIRDRLERLRGATCVRLAFRTPLAIRRSQRVLTWFDLAAFALALRDRWLSVAATYFGSSSADFDAETGVLEATRGVRVERAMTRTVRQMRLGRRTRKQPFHGIVGGAELSGDLAAFLPYLAAAEVLQVGLHTTFGYGVVDVERVRNDVSRS